jgi:hypothetical protein
VIERNAARANGGASILAPLLGTIERAHPCGEHRLVRGVRNRGVLWSADAVLVHSQFTLRELRGKYLVGADGAHSKVRELLGIEFDGRGVFSNSITIYFTADLSPWIGGRPISIFYIKNDNLAGFFRMDRECKSGFMVVSTVGDTKLPSAANPASDISEKRLIELLRWGIGVPDIPVKIDGVARWRATARSLRIRSRCRSFCDGADTT